MKIEALTAERVENIEKKSQNYIMRMFDPMLSLSTTPSMRRMKRSVA